MASAVTQLDTVDLVQSILDLFRIIQRAASTTEVDRARGAVEGAAGDLERAVRGTVESSGDALEGHRATRVAIESLLEKGIRTTDALDIYRVVAQQGRRLLAHFDQLERIQALVEDVLAAGADLGLDGGGLAEVHDALRDLCARQRAERPSVAEFVEDVEDIIAVIRAENDQGDEAPVSQTELESRLGLST